MSARGVSDSSPGYRMPAASRESTPPAGAGATPLGRIPDSIESSRKREGGKPPQLPAGAWAGIGIALIFPLWLLITAIRYAVQEIQKNIAGSVPKEMQEISVKLQSAERSPADKAELLSEAIICYWKPTTETGQSFLQMLVPCALIDKESEPTQRSDHSSREVLDFMRTLWDQLSEEEQSTILTSSNWDTYEHGTIQNALQNPSKHTALSAALQQVISPLT